MTVNVPVPVGITAIVGLVVLEGIAIAKGVDGAYLSMVVALIAAIAGVAVQRQK